MPRKQTKESGPDALKAIAKRRHGVALIAFAVPALAGLLSLFGARSIARRLWGPSESPSNSIAELQPVAFSVLGLLIFLEAFPVFLSNAVSSGGWFEENGPRLPAPEPVWTLVVATIVRMVLGLGLFLGGRPLARAWRWARTAGLPTRSPTQAPPA